MARRFLSNVRINDAYTLPASDGTNNQVIKTDGSGNLTFGQLATDSASVIYKDTFTGDGSTTTFTMANALNDENQSNIYIDGVYQSKSTYSVANKVITFSTAPASGHAIEVISTTGINSGPTAIFTDNFTANGSATAFTLGQTVHDENQTLVFLNGVYQFKNTYTLSGTTLTLDTAPANGVAIEVMSIGSAYSGGDILYDHDFTSAGLMKTNGSGTYSIVADNSSNWNTAYTYSQVGHLPLAGGTLTGNLIVGGDLTVNGTTTTLNTQTVEVEDNILQLNTTQGTPDTATATTSGISIYRGNGVTQASFIFDDGDDTWDLTNNLAIEGNIILNDNAKAIFGAGSDLKIFSDGSGGYIRGVTAIQSQDGSDDFLLTAANAGVSLFYNNVKKFETLSDGAKIHGEFYIDEKITHTGDGNTYLQFQTDRQTYVAGGVEFIDFAETTQNYITIGGSSDIDTRMQGGSGYIFIQGSNGYIGINDASPSYPFEVNGNTNIGGELHVRNVIYGYAGVGNQIGGVSWTSTDSGFLFAKTGNVTKILLNSNGDSYLNGGNVGIGTTSPRNDANFVTLQVGSTATAASQIVLDDNDSNGPWRIISNQSLIINDDATERMRIESDGTVQITNSTSPKLQLKRGSKEYTTRVDNNNKFVIQEEGGNEFFVVESGASSNSIRIDSSGNVGIGTTSPTNMLSIKGSSGSSKGLDIFHSNGNKVAQLIHNGSGDEGMLNLYDSNVETVRIAGENNISSFINSGNVGIGTTNPLFGLSMAQGTGDGNRIGWNDGGGAKRASIICSSSTDALQFHTGTSDAERMRIDSGGDVLMGNTVVNPASGFASQRGFGYDNSTGNVQIAATSGNALTVGRNESSDGAIMTLRKESNVKHSFGSTTSYLLGNVGIGTTSPGYKLHVSGTGGTRMSITNTDTNWAALQIQAKDNQADYIFFKDDTEERARIIAFDSSDLVFSNTDSATERMRITSAGNIGIGTTSPSKKLDIRTDNGVLIKGASGSTNANLSFLPASGGREYAFSNDSSSFYIKDISADVTRMYFHYNGNTGIGTTNPQNKFVVANGTDNTQNIEIAPNYIQSFNRQSGNLGYAPMGFYASSYAFNSGNVGIGTTSPAYKLHISEAVDRSLSSSQAQMRIEGNGYGAFFALNTDSFQIGQNSNSRDLTFHSGASSANILERMRIKSHGDVCIGGTSTQNARTASFDVGTNNIVFDNCTTSGAGNGAEFQTFRRNNGTNSVQIGSIVMNGTSGVTYATSSDYRLKENVVELTNALDRVDQLKPSRFNFISDEGRTIDGFLAHEVQDIVPEAVVGTKDGVDEDGNPKYQSIDQSKLVPLLVGAIKELKAEIEQLKTQING